MITLQAELEAFERLRFSLLDRAPGKYALVKGQDLIDAFGNEPFLVKHIVEADVPLNFTSFNLGM
jgi:hypothetical protein